jgi:hypothetical protein
LALLTDSTAETPFSADEFGRECHQFDAETAAFAAISASVEFF